MQPGIMDLLLGPLVNGKDLNPANPLDCFDSVELTTPIHSLFSLPGEAKLIDEARKMLRAGTIPELREPLPGKSNLIQLVLRDRLALYIESDHPNSDRLYVLEFQGPRQYLMFGHTTNLLNRITEHQRAATPHGFAMLNGWASPWIANAQPLEQAALFIGELIHGQPYRERFYEMPFEWGLRIVRTVYEMNSDWRSRAGQDSGVE